MSIADDMIVGRQCSLCGTCFTQEHGYPVVCKDCWSDLTESEREVYQRATVPEFSEQAMTTPAPGNTNGGG